MAAFLLIMVILFSVLTATISVIVNSYGTNMKTETLSNSANSAAVFIKNSYAAKSYTDFNDFLNTEERELSLLLELLSVNDQNQVMFLCTDDGTVIHFGGSKGTDVIDGNKEGSTIFGPEKQYRLPADINSILEKGNHVTSTDNMQGFFVSEHICYAIPLFEDGVYAGAVFAASGSTGTDQLLSTMTRTVTLAVLWIMLAALIAVYFITERNVSPIKDMSRAVKCFANGQFDARVDVIGTDEVAELARAFNNMADSLQNLEDMRRSFLANVSHDLRTPMTTISGFIDGIIDGAIPPEQHEYYLGIIAGEVRRLSRLVSSLLDISRIEAGERKFTPTVYDICEQGREIIISNIQRLEDKGLTFSLNAIRTICTFLQTRMPFTRFSTIFVITPSNSPEKAGTTRSASPKRVAPYMSAFTTKARASLRKIFPISSSDSTKVTRAEGKIKRELVSVCTSHVPLSKPRDRKYGWRASTRNGVALPSLFME